MSRRLRLLIGILLAALVASEALPAERKALPGVDTTVTRITRQIEGGEGEFFVHAFVLDLVGLENVALPRAAKGVGTPVYQVIQTSEGPYTDIEARARVQEIVKDGLLIGTHFWPLDRVQRVVIRIN